VRLRLKYALPLVQVGLAAGLFMWDAFWYRVVARHMDMPGTSPAFKLLVSINAPLALPRAFVFRHLPGWWDPVTFIVAIGLFWYWVGMNIVSWRERRIAYLFSWRPLRLLADALFIGVGVFWIVVCWNEIHGPNERLFSAQDWQDWLWYAISLGLPILWGIVLISFFGYDCSRSLVRSEST
jgi:hypothetical protein